MDMTEHLPECPWAPHDCDDNLCERCDRGCYCNELRACEQRVIDAAAQRVEALAKEWAEQTLAVQLATGIALAAVRGDQ